MCSSPGVRRSEAAPSNCTHITYNTHKQAGENTRALISYPIRIFNTINAHILLWRCDLYLTLIPASSCPQRLDENGCNWCKLLKSRFYI